MKTPFTSRCCKGPRMVVSSTLFCAWCDGLEPRAGVASLVPATWMSAVSNSHDAPDRPARCACEGCAERYRRQDEDKT